MRLLSLTAILFFIFRKPYSIKEFKIIVDYLVENKLYGETKARKMWVDFANTKVTKCFNKFC